VVGSSAVLRLKFCAKNPPLRQAANRCQKLYHKSHKPGEKQPAYGKKMKNRKRATAKYETDVLTADKVLNWLRL